MAQDANELFNGPTAVDKIPNLLATRVAQQTLAAGSGTIKKGTCLALDTTADTWKVFDAAGGATGQDVIRGIAYEDIVLDASNEVRGNVMMAGKVDMNTIPLGAETYAATLAALSTEAVRQLGIHVENAPEPGVANL